MSQPMTRTGMVKALRGHMAVVLTQMEPGCASCEGKDACSVLGGTGANREVTVMNTARAQVGDLVVISMRSSSVLKVSFLVYMVPILALIAAIVAGYWMAKLTGNSEEMTVGAFGAVAVAGSFLWIKRKGAQLSQKRGFLPEIVSTLDKGFSGAQCPSINGRF